MQVRIPAQQMMDGTPPAEGALQQTELIPTRASRRCCIGLTRSSPGCLVFSVFKGVLFCGTFGGRKTEESACARIPGVLHKARTWGCSINSNFLCCLINSYVMIWIQGGWNNVDSGVAENH
ncbi:unnamed protein product [Natator depressus]